MISLTVPSENENTPEVKAVFADIENRMHALPYFFRILSISPPLLKAYWESYVHVLFEGVLPQQIKEMIFLTVAREMRCSYCSSIHLALCDMLDVDKHNLKALTSSLDEITPTRIRLLLLFCLKGLKAADSLENSDFQLLYRYGITEKEALEALYTVVYSQSGVSLAKMLKVDVDPEIIDYLTENHLSIGFA